MDLTRLSKSAPDTPCMGTSKCRGHERGVMELCAKVAIVRLCDHIGRLNAEEARMGMFSKDIKSLEDLSPGGNHQGFFRGIAGHR